jgi:hypothetical protein
MTVEAKKIPEMLFKEFSQFGKYKERRLFGNNFLIKELDQSAVGFLGAVGLLERMVNYSNFYFWLQIPQIKGSRIEPPPLIIVSAGLYRERIWGYGLGFHMRETAMLEFPSLGVDLKNPCVKFTSMVLYRAYDLIENVPCKECWEVDIRPEGNYTKPP